MRVKCINSKETNLHKMTKDESVRFGKYEKAYGLAISVEIKDFDLFRENPEEIKNMFDRMYSHALAVADDCMKINILK